MEQNKEEFVVSTNQFVSEKMKRYNVLGIDDMMSGLRYQTAQQALQKKEAFSLTYAMDILKGKYGFMPQGQNLCQYDRNLGGDTVWSCVYDISNQTIYRSEGNPTRYPYVVDSRLTFHLE